MASLLIAAGTAALVGTPLTLLATHAARTAPQRLARLSAPTVVLGTALVLAAATGLLAARYGLMLAAAAVPALLLAAAAALTDVRECRLPNVLTWPLLAITLAAVLAAAVVAAEPAIAARAGVGAAAATAMMLLAKLARPAAVGWGDIKFAPSLNAPLGAVSWSTLYAGLVSWWILIAVLAGLGLATGLLHRSDRLPYGPAMLVGTVLTLAAAAPMTLA